MNTHSRKRNANVSGFAIGFALLVLTMGQVSALAQTNTFPSSGNTGVGTLSPGFLFDVRQTTPSTPIANFWSTTDDMGVTIGRRSANSLGVATHIAANSASNWGMIQAWNYTTSSGVPLLLQPTAGNVGIGTTSPSERLVTMGNFLAGNITNRTLLYSSYDTQSNMIMELGYGTATSNITPLPSFVLSKNLTSTNSGVGVISFANRSIADGSEKRLSYISSYTDGATNSGALTFATTDAGTINERIRIDHLGNVGIGTTTPTRALEVLAPSGEAARFYRNGNSVGWGVNMTLALNNSSGAKVDYAGVHGLVGSNTAGAEGGEMILSTATSGVLTEKVRVKSNGFVGIGKNNPGYLLDVNGTINGTNILVNGSPISGSQWSTSGSTINYSGGNVGIGAPTPGFKLDVQGGSINASGGLCIAGVCKVNWSDVASQWTTSGSNVYYNSGNVGFGTTNPLKKVHIAGANSQILLDRSANTAGNYSLLSFSTNGTYKFMFGLNADSDPNADKLSLFDSAISQTVPVMTFTGGRVGIGTSSPSFKLDMQENTTSSTGMRVGNATSGASAQIQHRLENNTGAFAYFGLTSSGFTSFAPINGGRAYFGSNAADVAVFAQSANDIIFSTNGAENARIKSGGNVGIGTSTPSEKLEISGNIKLTGTGNIDTPGTITGGNVKAKYQDVAEWVPASEEVAAGTVVILDSTKSNHVTSSTTAYDTRVAGVISTQPGITLGEGGDNKALVATTGRVLVKVDATRAPIHVGDLLVTSDIAGVAMKSEPINLGGVQIHRPGTIVGKALEPLEKGSGKILVLLSLQ